MRNPVRIASPIDKRPSRVRKPSALLRDGQTQVNFPKRRQGLPRSWRKDLELLDLSELPELPELEAEEAKAPEKPKKSPKKPSKVCRSFTEEEDEAIRNAVEEFGDRPWTQIAERANLNRPGKAVRERYCNHLHPRIRWEAFSEEEDALILSMYETHGAAWAEIARHLDGRTDNQVKNRFNCRLWRSAGPLAKPLAVHKRKANPILREAFDEVLNDENNETEETDALRGLDFDDDDLLGQLAMCGPKSTALPSLPSLDMQGALDVQVTPAMPRGRGRPPKFVKPWPKAVRAPLPKPLLPAATLHKTPGLHIRVVSKVNYTPSIGGCSRLATGSFAKFNTSYKKACYGRN